MSQLRQLDICCHLGCLERIDGALDGAEELASSVAVLDRKQLLDLPALRRLLKLCQERSIDIVHTHDAASQFTGSLLRLRLPRLRLQPIPLAGVVNDQQDDPLFAPIHWRGGWFKLGAGPNLIHLDAGITDALQPLIRFFSQAASEENSYARRCFLG